MKSGVHDSSRGNPGRLLRRLLLATFWLTAPFAILAAAGAGADSPVRSKTPVPEMHPVQSADGGAPLEPLKDVVTQVLTTDQEVVKSVDRTFELSMKFIAGLVAGLVALFSWLGLSTFREFQRRNKAFEVRRDELIAELEEKSKKLDAAMTKAGDDYRSMEKRLADAVQKADDDSKVMLQCLADVSLLCQKCIDIEKDLREFRALIRASKDSAGTVPSTLIGDSKKNDIFSNLGEAEELAKKLKAERMLNWLQTQHFQLHYCLGDWQRALEYARLAVDQNVGEHPDRPYNLACVYGRLIAHDHNGKEHHTIDAINALEITLKLAKERAAKNPYARSLGQWMTDMRNDDDLQAIPQERLDVLLKRWGIT